MEMCGAMSMINRLGSVGAIWKDFLYLCWFVDGDSIDVLVDI